MKKITLIGNLGKDAQARTTAQGKTFYTFSVAVSEKYRTATGEEREETTWFDCLTNSEKIAKYLTKGKKVYIEGNPKLNLYHSEQTGETKASIQVSCTIIRLISPNDQARPSSPTPPQQSPKHQTPAQTQNQPDYDDLPF